VDLLNEQREQGIHIFIYLAIILALALLGVLAFRFIVLRTLRVTVMFANVNTLLFHKRS
jgi:Tfp pilus assembly protein PilX